MDNLHKLEGRPGWGADLDKCIPQSAVDGDTALRTSTPLIQSSPVTVFKLGKTSKMYEQEPNKT